MRWEKVLTQAAFATVLAIMALLPVTTYGCLKLQQADKQDEVRPPAGGSGDP